MRLPAPLLLFVTFVSACAAKREAAPASSPPATESAPATTPAPEPPPTGGGAPAPPAPPRELEQPNLERAAPTPSMHRRVGGEVKIGEAKVTGLDDGAVSQALDAQTDSLRKCYEKELLAVPSLTGTADVKISVDKDKSVSAKAEGVGNAALEACIAETLEKVDFGRPQGRAQVTVRITFSPES